MPERGDLTRSEVRTPACFHPEGKNPATWLRRRRRHRTTYPSIEPVEPENIDADGGNLVHGWLPLLVIFDDHHFGTQMP
jgi:hypothetical protein